MLIRQDTGSPSHTLTESQNKESDTMRSDRQRSRQSKPFPFAAVAMAGVLFLGGALVVTCARGPVEPDRDPGAPANRADAVRAPAVAPHRDEAAPGRAESVPDTGEEPTATAGANTPELPQLPELNWEQRSDWLNVKNPPKGMARAVGDGKADDTAAIQAAVDKVKEEGGAFSTVYMPPGTYRITNEILMRFVGQHKAWINLRGHGRHTKVVWDGPEGGAMFRAVGYDFSHSTTIGLVLDGRGKAARGFVFDGGNATKVLFEHMAFMNCTEQGSGATERRTVQGYLEGSEWRNCLFVNCGKGLAFWHWNDYVFNIDGCDFYDCEYGVYNRRGNFYVRNCHFERSKVVDVTNIQFSVGCSVRRSTSVGSHAFVQLATAPDGWQGMFTIQDCHVSGWRNPDWAVYSGFTGPLLIFDTVFSDAPSANPPIRLAAKRLSVVHSNNRTSTPQLFGGSTQHVAEVPPGQREGCITSAQQSFFRSEATIPGKVFDAKRDFGAKADGKSDDSDAVQRSIDAARQHGRGAIAYLPRGKYRFSKTINVTGRDYYVGGASRYTDVSESKFLVTDPHNVEMQYMFLNSSALRQTSTADQPSRMHYEHVHHMRAFELVGLSKDSVVTCSTIRCGKVVIENCSSARVLMNYIDITLVNVKGTQSDRTGFMGVLASQSQFLIEDNQSLVGSDCYQEQMGRAVIGRDRPYAVLRGSTTLPAGRVTISAPRMDGYNPLALRYPNLDDAAMTELMGNPFEKYFVVDDYHGRLASVATIYQNAHPRFDPAKRAYKIVCSGNAPIEILLMANSYQGAHNIPGFGDNDDHRAKPVIEGGDNVTRHALGCWLTHPGNEPWPNVLHANSLRVASRALDHFRELGEQDLALNYGESSSSAAPKAPSAAPAAARRDPPARFDAGLGPIVRSP